MSTQEEPHADRVRQLEARLEATESKLAALEQTRAVRWAGAAYGLYRKVRGARAFVERRAFDRRRTKLASRYLRGEGLEIGALHQPLRLPDGARARYVDRMSTEDLREHYPELAAHPFTEPDVIDDGETLASVPAGSVDFVIANHFIEHCQDPISAIRNHLRVLRPGGILYMAVPDKREIFDRDRPLTSLDHLVRDHTEGPEWSRRSHFEEYAALVDKAQDVEAHADVLMERDYSIHFHVWTPESFRRFLEHCRSELALPFAIEDFERNGFEFIAILRKLNGTARG
ncbi:MAG: methyltransferase domain-containing protein [Actinomycetota bacterium]|nr:methyltransferase domain-containing protein [Actinomycetota bacterium]